MVEAGDVRIVIDAGPHSRCQMLRTGVRRIDAILLTHEHVGPYRRAGRRAGTSISSITRPSDPPHRPLCRSPHPRCRAQGFRLRPRAQDELPGAFQEIELHEIDVTRPFSVKGKLEILPVSGHHPERFAVTGFRIGRLAYLTDFKTIADAEVEELRPVSTCWWSMRSVLPSIIRTSMWPRRCEARSPVSRRAKPT